jgi:hypothetical protein
MRKEEVVLKITNAEDLAYGKDLLENDYSIEIAAYDDEDAMIDENLLEAFPDLLEVSELFDPVTEGVIYYFGSLNKNELIESLREHRFNVKNEF